LPPALNVAFSVIIVLAVAGSVVLALFGYRSGTEWRDSRSVILNWNQVCGLLAAAILAAWALSLVEWAMAGRWLVATCGLFPSLPFFLNVICSSAVYGEIVATVCLLWVGLRRHDSRWAFSRII